MKRIFVMLSALAMMAAPAHAEHKLLITDMLGKGQSEIVANIGYSHSKYDFSGQPAIDLPGTARTNSTWSSFYAATGLGHGLQIYASIPYLFKQKTTYDYNIAMPVSRSYERDGLGDLNIGAKYLIVGEETAPVTLVAGLGLKFDMQGTKQGGTGTTNIAPYMALSRKLSSNTRVYAEYAAVFRNHGASDSHDISAGVEQVISSRVTAVVEGMVNFYTNNERLSDTEEFGAALSAYLQLNGNLYLIPSVHVILDNGTDSKVGFKHFDNSRSIGGAMALYYLF